MPDQYYLPSYIDTLAEAKAYRARQDRVRGQVNSVTPSQAVKYAMIAKSFPTFSPGIIRGLSAAGYGPSHPITKWAAEKWMSRQVEQGEATYDSPYGSTIPDRRWSPAIRNLVTKDAESFNGNAPPLHPLLAQQAIELGLLDRSSGLWSAPEQVMADRGYDRNSPHVAQLDQVWNAVRSELGQQGIGKMVVYHQGKYRNIPTSFDSPLQAERGSGELVADIGGGANYLDPSSPTAQRLVDINRQNMFKPPRYMNPETGMPVERAQQIDLTKLTASDPSQTFKGADAPSYAATDPFSGINPVVRGAFTAYNAGIQEGVGMFRNVIALTDSNELTVPQFGTSQSDLGIAIPRFIRGEEVDLGSGLIPDPDGAIAQERREREALTGKVGTHNISMGRQMAEWVQLEPDTWQFNLVSGMVDAGVNVFLDPTALLLGAAGKAGTAAKGFKALDIAADLEKGADVATAARAAQLAREADAGMIRGLRNVIDAPTSVSWVNKNQNIMTDLASLDSEWQVAKYLGFKNEVGLYRDLASISDPAKVSDYIITQIEKGKVRKIEELVTPAPKQLIETGLDPNKTRLAGIMPGQSMPTDNPTGFSRELVRSLQNVKAPESLIEELYNRTARVEYRSEFFDIWSDMLKAENGILHSHGVLDDGVRYSLTQGYRDRLEREFVDYWQQIGEDRPTWDTLTDGVDAIKTPSPHLLMEHINSNLPLPDPRAMRRLTSSGLGKIVFAKGSVNNNIVARALAGVDSEAMGVRGALRRMSDRAGYASFGKYDGELRLPLAGLDLIAQNLWKPAALLRAAWPLRVLSDLQLRLAASDYPNLLSHPIDYFALLTSRKVLRMGGANTTDPGGGIWDQIDELKTALVQKGNIPGLTDSPVFQPGIREIFAKSNEANRSAYLSGWATALAKYAEDSVVQQYFRRGFDDTVDDFYYGGLRPVRKNIQAGNPKTLRTYTDAQHYVRTLQQDMEYLSGGSDEILDVLRTGKYKVPDPKNPGKFLYKSIWTRKGKPDMNPGFTNWLKSRLDDFGPAEVQGVKEGSRAAETGRMKALLNWTFGAVMGKPENYFARVPMLKEAAWRNAIDMLPHMTADAQARILANADGAKLSNRMLKGLRNAASKSKGAVEYDEGLDLIRGYAADEVKNLMFDMSQKHQFSDMYRTMIPFGEAYLEVMGRWAKILTDNGIGAWAGKMPNNALGSTLQFPLYIGGFLFNKPVRRLQQGIQAARGEEFGQFVGAPILPNEQGEMVQQGFFFPDPATGDEMFYYPMSSQFMKMKTGVPFPLAARAQGLNMFSTFLPGLGPVAQVPIAALLDRKPTLRAALDDYLLPFGSPADNPSALLDISTYAPPWMRNAIQAFSGGQQDSRIYASSKMALVAYGYSTGEFDISTNAGVNRLYQWAESKTNELYMIRSLAQFFAPSSPTPVQLVQTQDGKLLSLALLAEDYYDMREDDYATANEKFLETYGENALYAMIPRSTTDTYGVVRTEEGALWLETHKDFKTNLPLTANLFAPTEGEFHYPTYIRQFLTGERDTIDPATYIRMGNQVRGEMWYRRAIDERGGDVNAMSDEDAKELADIKDTIRKTFPGFEAIAGSVQKPEAPGMIAELEVALGTPRLRDVIKSTDAGQGLIKYMDFRQEALDLVEQEWEAGLTQAKTPWRAKSYRPMRDWLRDRADEIIAEHPGFKGLWSVIFEREMLRDPVGEEE